MIVIGVTGTDGKTTTVNLIYHVLKSAGKKVSMISSIGVNINGKEYQTELHRTTPTAFMLQFFLKMAVNSGSEYVVLEITSHAIDQYRIWGINFWAGVITNVTHEHLDYHKTYENYVKTKAKLLKNAKVVIVNKDDKSYGIIEKIKNKIVNIHSKNQKWISYGIKDGDINPQVFPFNTKIIGEYNKYNILAAVGSCRALGIADSDIRKGVENFKLPLGRSEVVYDNDFIVMIDFAHTPNAIIQLLSSLRPRAKGKIIHVFGSAGKRDVRKRPLMGEASARYADIIILTAEDPRSESVEQIMHEIVSGIQNKTLFRISDRQEAITFAIKMARKGDFIVITGKGHEQSMNYGKGEVPWSEHEAVKKALESRR